MKVLSKDAVNWLAVDENDAGQRIDNFLSRVLKGVPKSFVYRILRSGEVRINSRRAGPEQKLVAGDRIRIPPVRTSSAVLHRPKPPAQPSVPVLFEDEALLAVNKPAGLAVHGGSGVSYGLIELLRLDRPTARFLELVHRLDRETSGVLLIAKKRAVLTELHASWREGAVNKRYLVLVKGLWRDEKRTVRAPLHKFVRPDGERRVRVEDDGQAAETIFLRKQLWRGHVPPVTLLEADPRTGRTHQIRVHLTHLGFPLAGDDKYGDFVWNRALVKDGLRRMFLHASSLQLTHPVGGATLMLEAPLPQELAAFLASLDAG